MSDAQLTEDEYHTLCRRCNIVKPNYLFTPSGLRGRPIRCQQCAIKNQKKHQLKPINVPAAKQSFHRPETFAHASFVRPPKNALVKTSTRGGVCKD